MFLVESATSENNTSENWEAIIGICEEADSSEYAAREAVGALSKRMLHRNVNVKKYQLPTCCGFLVFRTVLQLMEGRSSGCVVRSGFQKLISAFSLLYIFSLGLTVRSDGRKLSCSKLWNRRQETDCFKGFP